MVAVHACAHALAGQREGHHDDPPVDAANPNSKVCEVVNGELHLFMVLEGRGHEFLRGAALAVLGGTGGRDRGHVLCTVCDRCHDVLGPVRSGAVHTGEGTGLSCGARRHGYVLWRCALQYVDGA